MQNNTIKLLKFNLTFALVVVILKTGGAQQLTSVGINFSPSLTRPAGLPDDYTGYPFNFAYGFGITGTFNLNSQLLLRTGLGYELKRDLRKDIPDTRDLIDASGNINYDNIRYFDALTNSNYINIPIIISYKTAKYEEKKSSFLLSGGVEISYLYSLKEVFEYDDNEPDPVYRWTPDRFTLNLSVDAGAGFLISLSEKMFFIIESRYSYDFYASNDGERFHSLLLHTELNYRLK